MGGKKLNLTVKVQVNKGFQKKKNIVRSHDILIHDKTNNTVVNDYLH